MSRERPPRLAIIIVTYQRPLELARLLDSVVQQDLPRNTYEICLVDNGGELEQADLCDYEIEHWIRPNENIGASAGRNRGVEATTAPLMLFLDDDGVVVQGTFLAAEQAFQEDPKLIAARGRVLPLDHPILSSIAGHYDRGVGCCADWLIIEGMTAIRREPFVAAGGYDPALFGHEGIELSFRLLQRFPEGEIGYLPHMILRHDYAGSLAQLWHKGRRMAEASGRTPEPVVVRACAAYEAQGFSFGRSRVSRMRSWLPRLLFRRVIAYHRWRGVTRSRSG